MQMSPAFTAAILLNQNFPSRNFSSVIDHKPVVLGERDRQAAVAREEEDLEEIGIYFFHRNRIVT